MKINPNLLYDVLFEDSSGKSDTILLNRSAANYSYLEFFYRDGSISSYNNTKIYSPNGKRICLCLFFNGSAGTNTQCYNAVYDISGTNVTLTNWYGSGTILNGGNGTANKSNNVYITRVLGYK